MAQSKGFYLISFSKETSPSLQVLNWASHVGIEARLLSIQFMSFSDWSASLSRRNGNASCRLRHVQVQGLSFRSTGNQPNAAKMLTCGERQHYYWSWSMWRLNKTSSDANGGSFTFKAGKWYFVHRFESTWKYCCLVINNDLYIIIQSILSWVNSSFIHYK